MRPHLLLLLASLDQLSPQPITGGAWQGRPDFETLVGIGIGRRFVTLWS